MKVELEKSIYWFSVLPRLDIAYVGVAKQLVIGWLQYAIIITGGK